MQLIDNDVTRATAAWVARIRRADLRALVLAVLIVCLGATPISVGSIGDQSAARATTLGTSANTPSYDRTDEAVSRFESREAPASPSAKAKAEANAKAKAPAKLKGKAKAKAAKKVRPVAGLNQRQMDHAKTIVAAGEELNMPKQAYVIAIATSMQETNLRNLANTGMPSSTRLPNDGTGFDHDSVGLFQQRPASGWGSANQLMDPATAARKFYLALGRVDGWQNMPITVAAQTVQGSAFPDAYAKHEAKAETVVDALTK